MIDSNGVRSVSGGPSGRHPGPISVRDGVGPARRRSAGTARVRPGTIRGSGPNTGKGRRRARQRVPTRGAGTVRSQAACAQVGQVQSSQVHEEQESSQCSQEQTLWLQVGQVQSSQVQVAQESEQCGQLQVSHSS